MLGKFNLKHLKKNKFSSHKSFLKIYEETEISIKFNI